VGRGSRMWKKQDHKKEKKKKRKKGQLRFVAKIAKKDITRIWVREEI
jgi:hypothetical protein